MVARQRHCPIMLILTDDWQYWEACYRTERRGSGSSSLRIRSYERADAPPFRNWLLDCCLWYDDALCRPRAQPDMWSALYRGIQGWAMVYEPPLTSPIGWWWSHFPRIGNRSLPTALANTHDWIALEHLKHVRTCGRPEQASSGVSTLHDRQHP